MSTPSRRRLMRDLKRLQEECPEGITAAPTPDNIMVWNAVIFGPEGTPFEDGTFHLELTFDESYPNNPPRCRFLTPIFHPNIYTNGSICLDILNSRWSPTYDVTALLTSIQSLLPDPNPASAANGTAANMFSTRRAAYEAEVRKSVEESWKFKLPGTKDSDDESEAADTNTDAREAEESVSTNVAEQATATDTSTSTEAAEATTTVAETTNDTASTSNPQTESTTETKARPRKRSKAE